MPTLVKLFEAGIAKADVGHNIKKLMAYVKAALKAIPEFSKNWNQVLSETYRKAAQQALDNAAAAPNGDLFSQPSVAPDLFNQLPAPKKTEAKPPEVKKPEAVKPPVEESIEKPAGTPAGRDIPPKSGLNYRFGDDDLTYAGGWQTKARQNIEAVALLKQLEAEKRQATPKSKQSSPSSSAGVRRRSPIPYLVTSSTINWSFPNTTTTPWKPWRCTRQG